MPVFVQHLRGREGKGEEKGKGKREIPGEWMCLALEKMEFLGEKASGGNRRHYIPEICNDYVAIQGETGKECFRSVSEKKNGKGRVK